MFEGILTDYIKKHNNIVIASGAGISTNAGIPDYRSYDKGLYNNTPEEVFSISYFKINPIPFYSMMRSHLFKNYKPTFAHGFIKMLEIKGKLLRHYTQNIDGLSTKINESKLIEVHGSNTSARCIKCTVPFAIDEYKALIYHEIVPYCSCGGLVKPDIVFYGESIPDEFMSTTIEDRKMADLLIITGTTYKIHPFCDLSDILGCDDLYINNDISPNDYRRFNDILKCDCDEVFIETAKELKWYDDIMKLLEVIEDESHEYILPKKDTYVKFAEYNSTDIADQLADELSIIL